MKIKKTINFLLITLILISSVMICYADDPKLENPLGVDNIPDLIGKIIQGVLGVVGSMALLMFIFGGITWMTSGGNEEKIKKGKQIIVWAIFGIVIIFTSYSILNLVFEILGS
jgi:type IV secretory pathway VirB2 component (pilin)